MNIFIMLLFNFILNLKVFLGVGFMFGLVFCLFFCDFFMLIVIGDEFVDLGFGD